MDNEIYKYGKQIQLIVALYKRTTDTDEKEALKQATEAMFVSFEDQCTYLIDENAINECEELLVQTKLLFSK